MQLSYSCFRLNKLVNLVFICDMHCAQNPIIMDIPVELPQVKVKVLHANQYDEMDFKQEASGSKVAEEINLKGNVSFQLLWQQLIQYKHFNKHISLLAFYIII